MKKVFALFLILLITCFLAGRVLAADKVEINTATLQELDQITGIGPALAQRIIDTRPFSSVDDLLKVKGIGEKTLQKIKDQGLAYVSGQTQQTAPETSQPQQTAQAASQTQTTPVVNQTQPAPPPAPAVIQPPLIITYPSGIFINEILPAPAGADDQNEYIEIYNSNAADVDVSGWKLQDTQGTPATYIFPKDLKMLANGYLVLKRPDTNITLNNDGDGLNLLSPDQKIADSVNFANAPKNQSYNKTKSDWQWSITITPGAKNIIAAPIEPAPPTKKQSKVLPSAKKTDSKYLSALSEPANVQDSPLDSKNTQSPWFLFLGALIITIISGAIILLLKLKIFKKSDERTQSL